MSLTWSGFAAHVISARHPPGAGCRWRPFHPSGEACKRLLTSVANTVVVGVPGGSQTCHFLSVAVASESSERLFLPQCSLLNASVRDPGFDRKIKQPSGYNGIRNLNKSMNRYSEVSPGDILLREEPSSAGSQAACSYILMRFSHNGDQVRVTKSASSRDTCPSWRSKNIFLIFKHTHILPR